jgi:hypothetical protein
MVTEYNGPAGGEVYNTSMASANPRNQATYATWLPLLKR